MGRKTQLLFIISTIICLQGVGLYAGKDKSASCKMQQGRVVKVKSLIFDVNPNEHYFTIVQRYLSAPAGIRPVFGVRRIEDRKQFFSEEDLLYRALHSFVYVDQQRGKNA